MNAKTFLLLTALAWASVLPAQNLDPLPLNHIQVIGSHNSYKEAIDLALFAFFRSKDSVSASKIDYEHIGLGDQLSMGLRNLEIDVYADEKGGRYAHPKGLDWVRNQPPFDTAGIMKEPGFKVLHILDLDFRSHALTLTDALRQLKNWSEAHPNHEPVFITLECKDQASNNPELTAPEKFTARTLDMLDSVLLYNLGARHLLTPDQIRGSYPTLETAVLHGNWPLIRATRGKFIFLLDDKSDKRNLYIWGHPSLQGRVMFVNADAGTPEAALMILNDPKNPQIRELVRKGYIIRTRADSDTRQARTNDRSDFEAACNSGAQIITTDYYRKSAHFKSDYSVQFDGGKWVRINPVLSVFPKSEGPKSSGQESLAAASRNDGSRRMENPVIPGDFADPSVIRKGQTYYATGTSSEWAPHFPLFQSADLLHWKQIGYVFKKTPPWAAASFWAPELFYWKGTYYVYYVARKKNDGKSCIGVATAKDPAKGFTDHGILLEFGKEAIDPFILEENGKLYITWKAYGLDQRPIELMGCGLSGDGLKVEGKPFTLLRDDERGGMEGQCLVKRGDYYYLLYSVGNCCGSGCSYKIEVARSESLQKPFVKFANNPVFSGTGEWKCTGHGTIVTSKEGSDFYLYHAYSKTDDVYTGRQGMLGEVFWNSETGWPGIKPVETRIESVKNFRDNFSAAGLPLAWQWDFRHTQPRISIKGGSLYLSGQATAVNLSGTALTIRPLTGNYEIITDIANRNAALKGLVLYGDAGQSVGIGIKEDMVQVWEVKKDKRSVLMEERIGANKPVQLKMRVEKGSRCRFYWSEDGKSWKEVSVNEDYYNGDFLPPWDRSPRPGLMHLGAETQPAVFGFFEIIYR